ncbi:zinc-binding dehydrogenase [Nocardiopsis sp. L17-MgMaSL7]|uniref:zinc-dependent alcohol dehydrogenase n=1 Tax=Nocardiopsis sp. L17-MgMaSL7 TaxID=1938893 RepID=UPI000D71A1CB|nr:alcohol dehydrogenase catalytic domain-containing protein [Nocardiopsis sp. L17-MgMaSL7]PWV44594.1 alcohol dehydrogenase [Nocardiopsis sp. L17-MgMaSL7]
MHHHPARENTVRELLFRRSGVLEWGERPAPTLEEGTDAIVRPILAGRCDGDTLPIHRPVSRAMQAGMALGAIDPVVGSICGRVPFQGPFGIGHECVAEVLETGSDVRGVRPGDRVVVPWSVSCGTCERCRRGLTSKCATTARSTLAAYGFGPASGEWGGMVADAFRVPFADHMLVPVPDGVPSARVAAASDNLADAWRTVAGPLAERPGGTVLVLGGGAKSIGLYAAGLAVALGAAEVDYFDDDPDRRAIAESFGVRTRPLNDPGTRPRRGGYDVTVEATSKSRGLQRAVRALAPGGVCTAVGYYVAPTTRVPLMQMYANDSTLRLGVSHPRAVLEELLGFVARTGFEAERVTTLTADWEQAPHAYAQRATKVVLRREPLLATEPSC